MTDKPHTPTTQEVRDAACHPRPSWSDQQSIDRAEFDRWLATVEAAAEQRGAERALREAAKDWRWSAWADAPRNPIAAANYTGDWIENRADHMEAADES